MPPSADPPAALPPFAQTAPHFSDPEGRWHAWLTEPAGVYDFTIPGAHVSDAFSVFMEGPITAALDATFGPTSRLYFVHDWRFVTTYSVTVRAKLVKWGLSQYGRTRVRTITALLRPDSPLMVRTACAVGRTLMAAGDVDMEVRTPDELTFERELRPLPRERVRLS